MKVNIIPYVKVNEIMFGMTSLEISHLIKKEPRKFRKLLDDSYETDDYGSFFIYYNDEGKCEAVEYTEDSCLELFDIPFFSINYQDLKERLLKFDENIVILEDGLISNKYGFSIYVPDVSNLIIESVLFFAKDYWE